MPVASRDRFRCSSKTRCHLPFPRSACRSNRSPVKVARRDTHTQIETVLIRLRFPTSRAWGWRLPAHNSLSRSAHFGWTRQLWSPDLHQLLGVHEKGTALLHLGTPFVLQLDHGKPEFVRRQGLSRVASSGGPRPSHDYPFAGYLRTGASSCSSTASSAAEAPGPSAAASW
jgi:hypothetical protein